MRWNNFSGRLVSLLSQNQVSLLTYFHVITNGEDIPNALEKVGIAFESNPSSLFVWIFEEANTDWNDFF